MGDTMQNEELVREIFVAPPTLRALANEYNCTVERMPLLDRDVLFFETRVDGEPEDVRRYMADVDE